MAVFVENSHPIFRVGDTFDVAAGLNSAQSPEMTYAGDGEGEVFTVRLNPSVACRVSFGVNPTAAAGKLRLPADSASFWRMENGEKIAAIRDGDDDGVLSVAVLLK